MKEAMDVLSTKILSRKQSVPSGDCRGSYVYRVSAFGSRRTTDTGLPTFDSKSSTPALLEPVDLVTDCSHFGMDYFSGWTGREESVWSLSLIHISEPTRPY